MQTFYQHHDEHAANEKKGEPQNFSAFARCHVHSLEMLLLIRSGIFVNAITHHKRQDDSSQHWYPYCFHENVAFEEFAIELGLLGV